jgi:pimeloyl-ACP methyl ester carboxylesterase
MGVGQDAPGGGAVLKPVQRRARSADGTEIGWRSWGAGPPLLLVHGSMTDGRCWDAVAALLSADFELHVPDRRGRGLSPAAGTQDLDAEVADLRAVLAAIGRPAAVGGWSFGAVVALEAVLRGAEVEALAVYEPPLPAGMPGPPPGFREEFAALVDADEHDAAARLFLTRVLRLSGAVVDVMRAFPLWHSVVAGVPAARWELQVLDDYRYDAARVGRCLVPTTVLAGSESPRHLVAASERLAADLPAGRLVGLPGQHHFALISDPAGFAEHLRSALLPGAPARGHRTAQ